MKKPVSPPTEDELLRQLAEEGQDLIAKAINYRTVSSIDTPYLHWDQIRHRKPPDGLTHHEWWWITKLSRLSIRRELPLKDVNGTPFSYTLPDEVLRETDFISTNAGGHISSSEEVANPATRDRYLVDSLIEEAIRSSQLEGASTSRQVAKELIRSWRSPRDRSERMILNNFRAMERLGEIRNDPLTVDLICEIHNIVTEGTLENPKSAGRFQLPGEHRVGVYDSYDNLLHSPPLAQDLPDRVQDICDFANDGQQHQGYLPGVLRALTLHFMIGYEHPFEDGNGRTARVLFYWSMLNQGYWLTEFLSVSRILKLAPAQYARSFLYTETDANDLTYFYIYHLRVLHRAIDDLNRYLARKMAEVRELSERLRRDATQFNHRQFALLHNALKNPGAHYSVQSHSLSHRVSTETARKDLLILEQQGLLTKMRIGKRDVYTPAPGLPNAIKDLGA